MKNNENKALEVAGLEALDAKAQAKVNGGRRLPARILQLLHAHAHGYFRRPNGYSSTGVEG